MESTNNLTNKTKYILGLQHMLAMFGATVLVPIQIGMDPTIALLSAGIGTLIFHFLTGGMVPVFLGSSFAFIFATQMVLSTEGLDAVKGGIIVTGFVYVFMSLLIKSIGIQKIQSFFPAIVNGPIIVVIGLRLSPIALSMSGYSIGENGVGTINISYAFLSFIVVSSMIIITIFSKSFLKFIPILVSIFIGYIAALFMDIFLGTNFVDTQAIVDATWIGFSQSSIDSLTTMPTFSISAIVAIAPISIVVFMEHIGDMVTNGALVGKNFFKSPGIHRTILGDGVATIVSGFLGGPVNTTYSENTAVLALTKNYDPKVLRIAAIYAIILSFISKFGAIVQNIPTPIMGGVSIILFGMIASIGIRTLIEAKVDFSKSRNLVIASIIFVLGIGIGDIAISNNIAISGLAVAALAGVLLNKIIPHIEDL